MRVVFAINTVGLGHATRSLPLIRGALERGHEVSIISNFRSLAFLKNELGNKIKRYFRLHDYSFASKLFSNKKVSMQKFILNLPLFLKEYKTEHDSFIRMQKRYKFECIITDTRFGIFDRKTPSYLLSHHIRNKIKGLARVSEMLSEIPYFALMSRFRKILIPDFRKGDIAGSYTHGFKFLSKDDVSYLGVLSMIQKRKVKEDIDYFFTVSGPEPQRTVFEKKVLACLPKLEGKRVVVTLGKPEVKKTIRKGHTTIFSFLDNKKQEEMMNRAKLVVTRSGYTTVMELAELGKKALLIPTKGQEEQEYLAKYHHERGNYLSVDLDDLNLPDDLETAAQYPGIQTKKKTKDSVKRFLDVTGL
ncbi:MAG: glycosyltransferase family protein [archaeon]